MGQLLQEGMFQVVANERSQGGHQLVGVWLAVDFVDSVLECESVLLFYGLFQFRGQGAVKIGDEQSFAQVGAAAFIAQHVAQRWSPADQLISIVETSGGAGTQNASNGALPMAKGMAHSQEIGMDDNVSSNKERCQKVLHSFLILYARTTRSIVHNLADFMARLILAAECAQALPDLFVGTIVGVDARSSALGKQLAISNDRKGTLGTSGFYDQCLHDRLLFQIFAQDTGWIVTLEFRGHITLDEGMLFQGIIPLEVGGEDAVGLIVVGHSQLLTIGVADT